MIELDGHALTIPALWSVSQGETTCLPERSRRLMRRSRALVDKLAAQPRAIYGINTGFGPLSGTRVAPHALQQHQLNLLHHLSVGQGALFSGPETRAIMAARANAMARGFSGIRPEVVELLVAALNRGILPEIPCEGSVGASGDLAPLAHMTRLLVGLGHVRVGRKRLPAARALQRHGLKPVVLQCKEGLALVNGTSVMAALAALATGRPRTSGNRGGMGTGGADSGGIMLVEGRFSTGIRRNGSGWEDRNGSFLTELAGGGALS